MGAKAGAAPEQGAAQVLVPPVSVLKMRHALELLDAMYEENRDRFSARIATARESAREHTSRPLTAGESMAAALEAAPRIGVTEPDGVTRLAADIQGSELRMVDEPRGEEMFAAAIASLGTAAFSLALRFVALVELDDDTLEEAAERGGLDVVLDQAAKELERVRGRELVARSSACWAAVQEEWSLDPGGALGRLARPVWGALMEAMSRTADRISASSTPSLAATGGPDGRSSTGPGGRTP